MGFGPPIPEKKDFYHLWAWRSSWSCNQHHDNKFSFRKMENFRVVQFSRNFAVGRDPRKLKFAEYIPSLTKVKAIIHKRTKIRFCSSHFIYINQTETQV